MALRLLMCVPQGEDAAIPAFQLLRDACRAGVHRHATLGAALLFNGHCTLLLLEGSDAAVHPVHATLRALTGSAAVAWQQRTRVGLSRALPAGLCRSGYLDDDVGCETLHGLVPGQTDAGSAEIQAAIDAFLRLLETSDHD